MQINLDRIVYGTASLGRQDYGINNRPFDKKKSLFILKKIIDTGVSKIDVAKSYGNAEDLIGQYNKNLCSTKIWVSTKVGNIDLKKRDKIEKHLTNSIYDSIKKMNVEYLDLVYLHQNEINIFSDSQVIEILLSLKKKGIVKEIGVSLYTQEEVKKFTELGCYDWLQIPINICDTSLIKSTDNKTKIAARSIFLQGLIFLANHKAIEAKIPEISSLNIYLMKCYKIAKFEGISLLELAISYIYSNARIHNLVIGSKQLFLRENILELIVPLSANTISHLDEMSSVPKAWANPRNWRV